MSQTLDVARPDGSPSQAEIDLEILADAAAMASTYWKNYLWKRTHEAYGPSAVLYERHGSRYGAGGIEAIWQGWFATLTSDEYFIVLAGFDMATIGDDYGRSARRS